MTYAYPTLDEAEAELLGRLAALRGERIGLNPYDRSTMTQWFAWDLAWRDEHKRLCDRRHVERKGRATTRR